MDGSLLCPAGFTATEPTTTATSDCDDMNSARSPRAMETPCNGLDDDCNPATSDMVCPIAGQSCATGGCRCPMGQILCGSRCLTPMSTSCSAGLGVCQQIGVPICTSAGTLGCSVSGLSPFGRTEVPCNAADDNCNGVTDSDATCPGGQICNAPLRRCECPGGQVFCQGRCQVPPTCTAGSGACARTGPQICNSSGTAFTCTVTPDSTMARAETCNNVDDNCDGLRDNGAPSQSCTNAQGCGATQFCNGAGMYSACPATPRACPSGWGRVSGTSSCRWTAGGFGSSGGSQKTTPDNTNWNIATVGSHGYAPGGLVTVTVQLSQRGGDCAGGSIALEGVTNQLCCDGGGCINLGSNNFTPGPLSTVNITCSQGGRLWLRKVTGGMARWCCDSCLREANTIAQRSQFDVLACRY
jgi:hypothetical protein